MGSSIQQTLAPLASITSAVGALSGLILVSPQQTVGYQPIPKVDPTTGQVPPPPPAFLFNYEGEQSVMLTSDITDHFVEDNSAVQDQISLKPEEITTQGFVGELNDIPPNSVLAYAQTAAYKLASIAGYTPALSVTALLAYNEAAFLYATAMSAIASVSSLSNLTGGGGENVVDGTGITGTNIITGKVAGNQNKQQQYFDLFYGYWRARTLFTVQTPWAVFTNMAIKSLHAVQDAETTVITEFQITFKLLRFTETSVVTYVASDRAYQQGQPIQSNGSQTPSTSTTTLTGALSGVN